MRFLAARASLVAFGVGLAACGGGGGGSTPAPSPTPSNPYVITIASGGVASPRELTVPPGSRILFVNNDGRRHDMTSDDHPDHLECPALNQVGLLAPGQSRESGNRGVVRTCGCHEHEDPNNNNLKGQIIVR